MGWASYQEDNINARGESKSFARIQKASRRASRSTDASNGGSFTRIQKASRPMKSPNNPFKSTPVPTPRHITQQPKTLRPKPSPKTHQRIRRREPLKKQYVPVAKTRHVTSDEIQQRIQQTKPIKTQRVTTDDLQQRIQREIIRQQKESKDICLN